MKNIFLTFNKISKNSNVLFFLISCIICLLTISMIFIATTQTLTIVLCFISVIFLFKRYLFPIELIILNSKKIISIEYTLLKRHKSLENPKKINRGLRYSFAIDMTLMFILNLVVLFSFKFTGDWILKIITFLILIRAIGMGLGWSIIYGSYEYISGGYANIHYFSSEKQFHIVVKKPWKCIHIWP